MQTRKVHTIIRWVFLSDDYSYMRETKDATQYFGKYEKSVFTNAFSDNAMSQGRTFLWSQ